MIDTVKFRFSVSDKVRQLALDKSNSQSLRDGVVKYWQLGVKIPSSDRNINVLGYNHSKSLFVEFSPAKQIYGTNIIDVERHQIKKVVEEVRDVLNEELLDIPDTRLWIVQSIDLAYMWDYGDYLIAKGVLDVIKNFADKLFDTTCYKGHSKFYLKLPEYLCRTGDYRKLKYNDGFLAEDLKKRIQGLLRFEVRLNGKSVLKNLGSYSWNSIIELPEDRFTQVARSKLINYFNGLSLIKMTPLQVYSKLSNIYGSKQALSLMGYMALRDGGIMTRKDLFNNFDKKQRYRFNKLLKDAEVGVDTPNTVKFPDFSNIFYLSYKDLRVA